MPVSRTEPPHGQTWCVTIGSQDRLEFLAQCHAPGAPLPSESVSLVLERRGRGTETMVVSPAVRFAAAVIWWAPRRLRDGENRRRSSRAMRSRPLRALSNVGMLASGSQLVPRSRCRGTRRSDNLGTAVRRGATGVLPIALTGRPARPVRERTGLHDARPGSPGDVLEVARGCVLGLAEPVVPFDD
jgi:hypothetical protein